MLLPAEVQRFLLHDDEGVREQALRYFTDADDPSPVTADDLWTCLDRFPSTRGSCLRAMSTVPATERSNERLLGELRTFPGAGDPAHRVLGRLARQLPPDAARRALADEAIAGHLPGAVAESMARRIALSEQTFRQLIRELRTQAAAIDDDEGPDSPGFHACEDIAGALARHPQEATAWALDSLRDLRGSPDETGWLGLFALGVFRHLPLPVGCELLLDRIGDDEGDLDCEYAADALVRLGGAEVVRDIESRFLGADSAFQIYTADVLSRIKRPESEEALSRLLGAGADVDIDTGLADALCKLCTTSQDVLERICRMVVDDDYDPMITHLDEVLIATGKIIGWTPRDQAAWRAAEARRKRERELWQRAKELEVKSWRDPRSRAPAAGGKERKPLVFKPYGKKAKKK